MAECKQCNKSFHACWSCGLIGHEWDYCSDKCWNESKEKQELEDYVNTWTLKQLHLYNSFDEDDLCSALDYRYSTLKVLDYIEKNEPISPIKVEEAYKELGLYSHSVRELIQKLELEGKVKIDNNLKLMVSKGSE